MSELTLSEVARQLDLSPATLRRWVRDGIVPLPNGGWTPAAVAHARIVARLRERGHTLEQIREASESGRLAFGYMEQLFAAEPEARALGDAAGETGLEFVEQDVVGHMEVDVDGEVDLGRLRVAIAFADLAGYTRLTEEAGEVQAVDVVERFVREVQDSLPDDARVIKTIGDEVMIVGSDPSALVDWAVGFQLMQRERPWPRIGIHWGATLYRDGDYYGRAVNLAARVGARAAGGEVLVTRPVVEAAGRHLEFERIGEVKLKGFAEATELYVARRGDS